MKSAAKIQLKSETVSPFAGIYFPMAMFDKFNLSQLIDDQHGKREPRSKYSYSDTFRNMWSIFFCGGNCIEDIEENLRPSLEAIPEYEVEHAGMQLRTMKEL